MKTETSEHEKKEPAGMPDAWWNRVYIAVIISAIAVFVALWAFSKYFS